MKKLQQKLEKEGINFTKQADILDKIEVNDTYSFFVTLKDHIEKFMNHPTTRLIDPSKNETGIIRKHILDQIKKELVSKLNVNKWKNK